ncbi:VOC family protein [Mucilaginibacter sp. L3T2-6]|uniref:VOC family protein n=1 Tax=Mucilaginibacter sp. L3T2-6 TaxID=3062491 RepID=UPI002674B94A|nr:VOC family protein [Mucilaginibacter sp. L3T2-6]MDO3640510.1 VOC family protein [Mucilaginibacter sp. L3T2-6]MDV6213151.1 VOC family protein [Mucilaginibacter sp. L3T2-6]
MKVERINHLVLTVKDIDLTCSFYNEVLGMEVEEFTPRKKALKFGEQSLMLHQKGRGFDLEADKPTPGSIDISFMVAESIDQIKAELEVKGIPVEGMFERRNAMGKTASIYFRDPDRNLIEVSNFIAL